MDPARRQFEFMQAKINDAQALADSRLELLRRLVDNGMLTTNERRLCEQGECDDCDLTRDILKELADAVD